MDENEFFKEMDKRFHDLKLWFQNNGYMKPIGSQPRSQPKSTKYKIAKKPCQKCGGDITWDNYDEETHKYPDHVDKDGNLTDCPEYNPEY